MKCGGECRWAANILRAWRFIRFRMASISPPARSFARVLYVMYNSMCFEWDAEKNQSNQKKHAGIDFETASRVFSVPSPMLRKDRVIGGEQRWQAIGAVRTAVLLVLHVYRKENPSGEESIRIISAREADPRERRVYLDQAPY